VVVEEGVGLEAEQLTDRTTTLSRTQPLITERTSRVRATLGQEEAEGLTSRD